MIWKICKQVRHNYIAKIFHNLFWKNRTSCLQLDVVYELIQEQLSTSCTVQSKHKLKKITNPTLCI